MSRPWYRPRRDRAAGFVLMEALAALALGALVLMAVPLVAGLTLRNWQKTTLDSDRLETVAAGMRVLRRDVTAMRREFWGRRHGATYAFAGGPESLAIVVGGDGASPGPGRGMVVYSVRPDAGGSVLQRAAAPLAPDARQFDLAALRDPVVLLRGPWRYQFRYGRLEGPRLEWTTTWALPTALPDAIRLDVVDQDTGIRVLPPLILRPAAETEPGCLDERAGPCGG